MKLYAGLFYSPGLAYLPSSPLRDLQLSNPTRVQLFSLITHAELAQLDPSASTEQDGMGQGEALVYNHLEIPEMGRMMASRYLRQRLWAGAVLSFHHPSSQYPYTHRFSPTSSSPFSSPARSGDVDSDDDLNLTVHFASLTLYDGVLPPGQDEGAGVTVHDEMDPVVVGFRNKVEVRIARAVEG
ncbi:hypothetical protein BCR35DRAFT_331797 [Leucosporidium creatinivorum]|uniref:Uncharacterized protein n=1 Tax=Leucosporidium creatinivorum TaxID=106004 RepID=A0A1Y2FBM5_9BASI|nr:hypothetical protein BCR35DRAFT_331797 [Leucosporidium creatinivorum]